LFLGSLWRARLNDRRLSLHLLDGVHRSDTRLPIAAKAVASDAGSLP
jgi:hypothetical protein